MFFFSSYIFTSFSLGVLIMFVFIEKGGSSRRVTNFHVFNSGYSKTQSHMLYKKLANIDIISFFMESPSNFNVAK